MLQTLTTLHTLGVDTVKVSLVWQLIAPNANSTKRPANFDATNPADYPPGAWSRWDTLVDVAHELGMNVYFLVIGPAPAVGGPGRQPARRPGARRRVDAQPARLPGLRRGGGNSLQRHLRFRCAGDPATLERDVDHPGRHDPRHGSDDRLDAATRLRPPARVSQWGIWNEPNERSWMNPWYRKGPHAPADPAAAERLPRASSTPATTACPRAATRPTRSSSARPRTGGSCPRSRSCRPCTASARTTGRCAARRRRRSAARRRDPPRASSAQHPGLFNDRLRAPPVRVRGRARTAATRARAT